MVKFYRLEDAEQPVFLGDALARGEEPLFADCPCGPDDLHPDYPKSQWDCRNSECVVDSVVIKRRMKRGQSPASREMMNCPGCGQAMRFTQYLRIRLLVPIEAVSS
jgi:hypothetical protein